MPKYKADAYLRVSYAPDGSVESDSIANQKKLIEDFTASHPDIEIVSERVDDGYSGVLFDRPAFQEMMKDIQDGKTVALLSALKQGFAAMKKSGARKKAVIFTESVETLPGHPRQQPGGIPAGHR